MPTTRIRQAIAASLSGFGITPPGDNGDGYPSHLRAARQAGMDVNDWEETVLRWLPAGPIVDRLVRDHVRPDSTICEVGVGTGRWSRRLVELVPDGRLVLVDRSWWVTAFVRQYFRHRPQVSVERCDGSGLPFTDTAWADLAFSQGLFVTLKLAHCGSFMRDFFRVLKPGGILVFDFIDPETQSGWDFLHTNARGSEDVFSFHTGATIERLLAHSGFDVEQVEVIGKSSYIVARKRTAAGDLTAGRALDQAGALPVSGRLVPIA